MKETFRKSMRWLHNWASLVFGWLLFFIFLTGTLGYFDTEIDRWMMPELPMKNEKLNEKQMSVIALKHLNTYAQDSTRWEIYLPNAREDMLYIKWYDLKNKDATSFKPPHGKVVEYIKYIDPNTKEIVDVRETGGGQLLYKMHYLLHYVSTTTGRIIVGFATMVMLIALLTGVIVHINIFKDYFTFKQDGSAKSWLNGHLVTGVVALPFHLMITYSGLVFFIFFYMPLIPLSNYGKEMRMMIKDAFPSQKAIKVTNIKAPLIDIAPIVNDAKKEFGYLKTITIINPNDKSMEVQVKREYTTLLRANHFDKLYYDGNTGERIEKPLIEKPSANTFRSIMTGLHTGLFADNFFRWIYFTLGILGTYMIASGLVLWTKKRQNQKEQNSYRFVDSMNAGTIVGLCSGIAAYFIANRVVPIDINDRIAYEANSLFLVWLVMIIIALFSNNKNRWQIQFFIASILFLLIPFLNFIFTEKNIFNSFLDGDMVLAMIDLLFIISGIIFGYLALKQRKKYAFC